MNVFDSSALLVFVYDEPGADIVQHQLEVGGLVGAANWSEVAQKLRSSGDDWNVNRGMLLSFSLSVESVSERDAETAAQLWKRGSGLSLADRLCLALAERYEATVWTADSEWRGHARAQLIR